ncbi:MAG: GGDEF domain-containing protein [Actinomycetota bacterium]|nr:GGDEF domain-containing protein [Actinomycetota bacterium]
MGILTSSSDLGAGTEYAIHRMTGEFVEPATERRYRCELLETNRHTYAMVSRLIAAVLPLFALIDLQSLGPGAPWLALLVARLATAAAVFMTGRRIARRPTMFVELEGRLVLILTQLTVIASALLACVLRPQDATTNAISLTVLMLAALVVVPGRFREQVALATSFMAGLVAVSLWRFREPTLPLAPLVANLTVAVAWGAFMLSFNNRAQRRQWTSTHREAATTQRLNDELVVAARLRGELQQLARQDPLTSASNRREFMRVSTDRLQRLDGGALSMLVIDIDRFKSINDRFGHATGDDTLVWLVEVLRGALRAEDLLARIGGEEFAVLLPGLDATAALATARRLLGAIADAGAPSLLPEPLTVSIGVSSVRAGDSAGDLMARADQDMYEAKRRGGNDVGRATRQDAVAHAVADAVDAP